MSVMQKGLQEKLLEAIHSVLPIVLIVLVLCFVAVPVSSGILLTFLTGGTMLIFGMMFFTLGAELSISTMGELVGSQMTKTKKLSVIMLLSLLLALSSPCPSRTCRCWRSLSPRSRTWC